MATGRVPTTANSPLTAKGDLFGYSTAPARLAVGNDGEQIVADSSTSTGLRYQGSMAAGKNAVINGGFDIWQRGTSFSSPANSTYIADRWFMYYDGSGATRTISQQTFTGDNPSGCNASYYLRWAQTVAGTGSTTNAMFSKNIEDVRNFNGQTVTVSFWAKADASRTITLDTYQEFGTGGSGAVLANSTSFSATTSWQRFNVTIAMPSVTGKTITSNSSISFILAFPPNTVQTIEVTGLQLELGSVATRFTRAGGTIQGELAACRRYLPAFNSVSGELLEYIGYAYATNGSLYTIPFDVPARTKPTGVTVNTSGSINAFALNTPTSVTPTFNAAGLYSATIIASHTITAGQGSRLQIQNGSSILFTGCEL